MVKFQGAPLALVILNIPRGRVALYCGKIVRAINQSVGQNGAGKKARQEPVHVAHESNNYSPLQFARLLGKNLQDQQYFSQNIQALFKGNMSTASWQPQLASSSTIKETLDWKQHQLPIWEEFWPHGLDLNSEHLRVHDKCHANTVCLIKACWGILELIEASACIVLVSFSTPQWWQTPQLMVYFPKFSSCHPPLHFGASRNANIYPNMICHRSLCPLSSG